MSRLITFLFSGFHVVYRLYWIKGRIGFRNKAYWKTLQMSREWLVAKWLFLQVLMYSSNRMSLLQAVWKWGPSAQLTCNWKAFFCVCGGAKMLFFKLSGQLEEHLPLLKITAVMLEGNQVWKLNNINMKVSWI